MIHIEERKSWKFLDVKYDAHMSYRVGSVNFSQGKIGHAHNNSAYSENVAGAREWNMHVHFIFRFENGQENQSLISIHDQNKAETSRPQAQPTDE